MGILIQMEKKTPEEDPPLDKKGSGNDEQGKSSCGIKRLKLIPAQGWTMEILPTVLCRYHPLKIMKIEHIVVCSVREFYHVKLCVLLANILKTSVLLECIVNFNKG